MDKNDKRPELTAEELKAIGEIEIGPAKHEVFLNNHYKKLLVGILVASVGAGLAIAHFSNKNDESAQAASLIIGSIQGQEGYTTTDLATIQTELAHSPSAATAKLIEALAELDGANIDAAISKLQAIANSGSDITITSRAAAAIANYYMGEKLNDKATAAWQQVANMPINPYSALAYMSLGDIAKMSGEVEAARSYYQAAQSKCATSSLINGKDIEMRLLLIDVDAPTPQTPVSTEAPADAPADTIIPSLDTELNLDTNLDSLPPVAPTTPTE